MSPPFLLHRIVCSSAAEARSRKLTYLTVPSKQAKGSTGVPTGCDSRLSAVKYIVSETLTMSYRPESLASMTVRTRSVYFSRVGGQWCR